MSDHRARDQPRCSVGINSDKLPPNSGKPLKNTIGKAVGWKIWPTKRLGRHTSLTTINEYFKTRFNAAAGKIVFQQTARSNGVRYIRRQTSIFECACVISRLVIILTRLITTISPEFAPIARIPEILSNRNFGLLHSAPQLSRFHNTNPTLNE